MLIKNKGVKMKKEDCKKLELIVDLPTEGKVDLSSFVIEYPIYMFGDDKHFYIIYFGPKNVYKFALDTKFPYEEPVFVKNENTCMEDVTPDDIKKFIVEFNSEVFRATDVIEKISNNIEARIELIKFFTDNLIKVLEKKQLDKIPEIIGNVTALFRVNKIDLINLREIVGDNLSTVEELNSKQEELIKRIIDKVNKELGVDFKFETE
jgi:DNA-binding ferritin-like protein (Dps family)